MLFPWGKLVSLENQLGFSVEALEEVSNKLFEISTILTTQSIKYEIYMMCSQIAPNLWYMHCASEELYTWFTLNEMKR